MLHCKILVFVAVLFTSFMTSSITCLVAEPKVKGAILVEQLNRLEIERLKASKRVDDDLDQIIHSIDRETQPREWAYAYSIMNERQSRYPEVSPASLLQVPQVADDIGLRVSLMRLMADDLIRIKGQHDKVVKIYEEAEKYCAGSDSNRVACGRLYIAWANYLFTINNIPASFKNIQTAISLLNVVQDPYDYFLLEARNTLHILLEGEGQFERAMEIAEANFHGYRERGFLHDAINESYNLLSYLLNHAPDRHQKIQQIIAEGRQLAEMTNDQHRLALIHFAEGKSLISEKRYAKGIVSLDKAQAIFRSHDDFLMYARAGIAKGRAQKALGDMRQARKSFVDAKAVLIPDYAFENMLIADSLHELAKAQEDYPSSLRHLEEYVRIFREQTENDKKMELARLSTQLGLQVEEERNKKLLKDNELKQERLEQAEVFKTVAVTISCLGVGLILTMALAWRKSRETRIAHKKMRMILENIDQGIFTIEQNLSIGSDYTWHLGRIFKAGIDPNAKDGLDQLFGLSTLGADRIAVIRETLRACLGEPELAWMLNCSNLPLEVVYSVGDAIQTLALTWTPVYNVSRTMGRILLCVQDITFRRQLEQEVDVQRQKAGRLIKVAEEMQQSDSQACLMLLNGLKADLAMLSHAFQVNRNGALRSLHTHKGVARTLGLYTLADYVHSIETALQQKGQADRVVQDSDEIIEEYRRFIKHEQFETGLGKSSLQGVVDQLLPEALRHVQGHGMMLAQVLVDDRVVAWNKELLDAATGILTHAINNSLDHGFIIPREKGQDLPTPGLHVQASHDGDFIQITLEDNGVGLDLERLKKLANERGFIPREGQTVADVVFEDGVSTATAVTIKSGRGVGLTAVQDICMSLGGRARIEPSKIQRGTRLTVLLPARPA